MATLQMVAKKISEKTGIDIEIVKEVLKEFGKASIEVLEEEKERMLDPQLNILGFGILKLEKPKRKRHPVVSYYPAWWIRKHLKELS